MCVWIFVIGIDFGVPVSNWYLSVLHCVILGACGLRLLGWWLIAKVVLRVATMAAHGSVKDGRSYWAMAIGSEQE